MKTLLASSILSCFVICFILSSCHSRSGMGTADQDTIVFQQTDTAYKNHYEVVKAESRVDSLINFCYRFLYNGENAQELRDTCLEIMKLVPPESSIHIFAETYYAGAYYYENDLKNALRLFNQLEKKPALEKYPYEKLRVRSLQYRMHYALGEYDDALRVAQKLLDIRPVTPDQTKGLKSTFSTTMTFIGNIYLASYKPEDGYRYFDHVLQTSDNPMFTTVARRDLEVMTAFMAYHAGHFDIAAAKIDSAMQMPYTGDTTGLARDYCYAADIYSHVSTRKEDAVECWKHALKLVEHHDEWEVAPWSQARLSNLYSEMGRFEDAAQMLYDALRTYEQLKRTAEMAYVYTLLADLHSTWKFYDKAQTYIRQAMDLSIAEADSTNLGNALLSQYRLCKAGNQVGKDSLYAILGQAEKAFVQSEDISGQLKTGALQGIELVEQPATRDSGIVLLQEIIGHPSAFDISQIHEARASLGMALIREQNEKAGLSLLLDAIQQIEIEEYHPILPACYAFLSDYYIKKGDVDAGLQARIRWQALRDTLFNQEKTRAVAGARIKYDTEKKEQHNLLLQTELELKKRTLQYYVLSSILLVLLLAGYIVYNRRLKQKNIMLVRQIEELGKQTEQLNMLRKALNQNPGTAPTENELFLQIERIMTDRHPYLDANLTRHDLSVLAGTNENYLAEAIRRGMDITFTEYLNHYRLQHARMLLSDSEDTIETIYLASGFTSRQTFYRLFKTQFGLPPTEFRKISKVIKS